MRVLIAWIFQIPLIIIRACAILIVTIILVCIRIFLYVFSRTPMGRPKYDMSISSTKYYPDRDIHLRREYYWSNPFQFILWGFNPSFIRKEEQL